MIKVTKLKTKKNRPNGGIFNISFLDNRGVKRYDERMNYLKTVFFLMMFLSCTKSYTYSEYWFKCSANSECIKVHAGCGRSGAVNKIFKSEYETYVNEAGQLSSCREPRKEDLDSDKKATPVCIKNKCDLENSSAQNSQRP